MEGQRMDNEVTTQKLLEDLRVVVRDAEALIRATSAQTGEKLQEARARAEESLKGVKTRLLAAEEVAVQRAKEAADVTEAYVREKPWQALGVAAGVGVLVGLILSRK
jgi:ElaB/YqjD/DUF883 family membrane-anchored ribosome-binding protein